jgi:hypothetical protein
MEDKSAYEVYCRNKRFRLSSAKYFDRKQTNLCQEDGCAHETPGLQPRHVQEADVYTSQASTDVPTILQMLLTEVYTCTRI